MSEKARKGYEENKNEASKSVADQRMHEPGYDSTEPEAQLKKALGSEDREEGSGLMAKDYPIESIAKENNTSTKNDEAKLRTRSDKEC